MFEFYNLCIQTILSAIRFKFKMSLCPIMNTEYYTLTYFVINNLVSRN